MLIFQVYFARDCGVDNLCETDLVLNSTIVLANEQKAFVLGESRGFQIHVHVKNLGEDSYNTELVIIYPNIIAINKVKTLSKASLSLMFNHKCIAAILNSRYW